MTVICKPKVQWRRAQASRCCSDGLCTQVTRAALQVANAIFMMPRDVHDSNPVVQAMLQGLSWCEKHRSADLASRNAYLSSHGKVQPLPQVPRALMCSGFASFYGLLNTAAIHRMERWSTLLNSCLEFVLQAIAQPIFCFETAFKLLTLSRASYAEDARPAGWERECTLPDTLESAPDQLAMSGSCVKDDRHKCYCGFSACEEVCIGHNLSAMSRLQCYQLYAVHKDPEI